MTLITCENAAFAYENGIAVEDLHFSVKSGDYLCVFGENGAGKTTLLKGLLRLLPPVKGRVIFDSLFKPEEIGFLPQQNAAQKDFPASVREVVLSGRTSLCGARPFFSKKDKISADEHMKNMGISTLRNACYRELSGGQKQRVLLARAFCAMRKALFLDEPVAGLDPIALRDLYRRIASVNRDTGVTIVMVTHDLQGVLPFASHILHIQKKQLFFGTAAEYEASELGRAFLRGGDNY